MALLRCLRGSSRAGLRPSMCEGTYFVEGDLLVVPAKQRGPEARYPKRRTPMEMTPTPHFRLKWGVGVISIGVSPIACLPCVLRVRAALVCSAQPCVPQVRLQARVTRAGVPGVSRGF